MVPNKPTYIVLTVSILMMVGYAFILNSRHEPMLPVTVPPLVENDDTANVGVVENTEDQQILINLPGSIIDAIDSNVPPHGVASRFFADVDEAELDRGVLARFLDSKPVERYRIVKIDSDAFRSVIRDSSSGQITEIELFSDEIIGVKSIQREEHASGWQTGMANWIGKIVGQETSSVQMLLIPGGGVRATFVTSTGYYRIEQPEYMPYHVLWQMDRGATADTD
jgi:hypothetical protein